MRRALFHLTTAWPWLDLDEIGSAPRILIKRAHEVVGPAIVFRAKLEGGKIRTYPISQDAERERVSFPPLLKKETDGGENYGRTGLPTTASRLTEKDIRDLNEPGTID